MNLVLLSGESVSNKPWIESVEKQLHANFERTKILYYDHWQTGDPTINLIKEYTKLTALTGEFSPYQILAKSIGTVLVVRGVYEHKLNPIKCIFIGPAFLVIEEKIPGFKNWLEGFSVPTLFITKTADPVAPAPALRALLSRYHVQNFQFVEIPGDNHKYENLEELKKLVSTFLTA